MARLLALQILTFFLFFTISYSSSVENGELLSVADGSLLISLRRVLTESPVQSNTSPDHSFVKAVGATAMGSLATAGVFTFFFRKCSAKRRRHKSRVDSAQRISIDELVMKQQSRSTTGTILDDDDDDDDLDELDLLYWRKLESGQLARNFSKVMVVNPVGEEVPTGFEKQFSWNRTPFKVTTPRKLEYDPKDQVLIHPIAKQRAGVSSVVTDQSDPSPAPPPPPVVIVHRGPTPPRPPPPPPTKSANRVILQNIPERKVPPAPPIAHPHPMSANRVISQNITAERQFPTSRQLAPSIQPMNSPARASLPPAVPINKSPTPTPTPATIQQKKISAPPPPPPLPPIPTRKAPAHPHPHPHRPPLIPANRNPSKQTIRASGIKLKKNLSVKPPQVPRRRSNSGSMEKGFTEEITDAGEVKLKPLHWDKVVANTDHSMVWDEINNGSFRFDDELMVSLFGYTASKEKVAGASNTSGSKPATSPAPAQNFILDPRKSQNIAIVLKSLSVSRKEILDALLNGEGLSGDQLEKLSTLSPTQEETTRILQFDGNPTKLATAESFLYHILKALPSAFTRIDAMLFRSIYEPEILNQKESLQTLELACKDLKKSEIFVRLLEAILKAGNKLNAGTARGNAQGFHLTALKKLSDVKSINGKTTLLHFVIEQVVRSEGRRCVVNRDHVLERGGSQKGKVGDPNPDSVKKQEQKDKEYMMLGLPVLGGLSVELSNVKKAATIEYDSFISACSLLTSRVAEIKKLVTSCQNERGGFVLEMKAFLEGCEEELKVVGEEQMRVLELVKRTTEYYQAGVSKEKGINPFHLFKIIKDFVNMVDPVCIDITQKSKVEKIENANTSPPLRQATTNLPKFPNIQAHFFHGQSKHSTSSHSDSEGDF
ncbi:unnamed protein product [Rhodiola kirilowii]